MESHAKSCPTIKPRRLPLFDLPFEDFSSSNVTYILKGIASNKHPEKSFRGAPSVLHIARRWCQTTGKKNTPFALWAELAKLFDPLLKVPCHIWIQWHPLNLIPVPSKIPHSPISFSNDLKRSFGCRMVIWMQKQMACCRLRYLYVCADCTKIKFSWASDIRLIVGLEWNPRTGRYGVGRPPARAIVANFKSFYWTSWWQYTKISVMSYAWVMLLSKCINCFREDSTERSYQAIRAGIVLAGVIIVFADP